MSRMRITLTDNTTIFYGQDRVLGAFIDIVDKRFAEHPMDSTGEGYILQWDRVLEFTSNHVKMTENEIQAFLLDLDNLMVVKQKVEDFIKNLPPAENFKKKIKFPMN